MATELASNGARVLTVAPAQLVRFLVSPSAAYLTGTIYAIDGGFLPVVS
ncbi:hypothetical protein [Dyadobacter sp. 32]